MQLGNIFDVCNYSFTSANESRSMYMLYFLLERAAGVNRVMKAKKRGKLRGLSWNVEVALALLSASLWI